MLGRAAKLIVLTLALIAVAPAASGQAPPAPPQIPLRPGEILVPMKNCSMVFEVTPQTDLPKITETYAKLLWQGQCVHGLVHGWGTVGEQSTLDSLRQQNISVTSEAFYGRFLGGNRSTAFGGDTHSFGVDGRGASFDSLANPNQPSWGEPFSTTPRPSSSIQISEQGKYRVVRTTMGDCTYWGRETWDAEARRANAGCRQGAQFKIYGVTVASSENTTGVTTYCPDPKSPAGCEALWRQLAGPLLAEGEAIRSAAAVRSNQIRAEVGALMNDYEQQLAVAERARQQAAAQRAAEAQAAAVRRDEEFRAGLATKNAGQLFALADEMSAAGESGKARETLRTLISRFPDHPLAVTAAQQLSAMSSAPSSSAGPGGTVSYNPPSASRPNPPSASSSPAAMGSCANAEAEEERLGQQAYQSGQKFPGEVVRPMESLLWAVGGIVRMYESCPSHPNAAAKLQTYRKLYNDTMTTCSQLASAPPCQPRLH